MNIFLSWSGDESKALAKAFHAWLPKLLQNVSCWMSSEDIRSGGKWAVDIAAQLQGTNFGIVFCTNNNVSQPWLVFEAGALSKLTAESHVCTLLRGVENNALIGSPLSQFQSNELNQEGVLKLITDIHKISGSPLKDEDLVELFDVLWPKLSELIENIPAQAASEESLTSDRELLEEILDVTRTIRRTRDQLAPIPFKGNEKVLLSPARTQWVEGDGPITHTDKETGKVMHMIELNALYQTPVQKSERT